MKKLLEALGYFGLLWYTFDDALALWLGIPALGIVPWPVIIIPAIICLWAATDP